MKKTFALTAPGKDPARVRDQIRHEVNKYFGRQNRKAPPTGFDYWTFECKVGATPADAAPTPQKEIGRAIDAAAAAGATEIYIAIVATPQRRRFSG
ncbi:MAG: hypothetical protein HZA93_25015 [Verrucomicrobia bacterium]|nr:hypothetical protein [Verrucomicrobiota bacterium]